MDFDFRLKVFFTAAQHLSFTKAAAALYISQPAISKNIIELEKKLGVSLFDRKGNSLELTAEGQVLFKYAKEIFILYNKASQEILDLQSTTMGSMELGASTTLAQYILPPLLATFLNEHPNYAIKMAQFNTRSIEEMLIDRTLDLAVTEGITDNRALRYIPFMKDELVLVTNAANPMLKSIDIQCLDTLYDIPLVLREKGSGTRTVIENNLKALNINLHNLKTEIILASTESIKMYIQYRNTFAFLSIHSIQKELLQGQLKIVDIKGLQIERYFYFTHLYGGLTGIPNQFLQYCMSKHNL